MNLFKNVLLYTSPFDTLSNSIIINHHSKTIDSGILEKQNLNYICNLPSFILENGAYIYSKYDKIYKNVQFNEIVTEFENIGSEHIIKYTKFYCVCQENIQISLYLINEYGFLDKKSFNSLLNDLSLALTEKINQNILRRNKVLS